MTRASFRWCLRSFSLLLAVAMTWSSRFYLDPDGMSYVDLANFYLKGDWHNALSSYWSPLYPWLLTISIGIFRPSPEALIPLTHWVCLAIFVGTLACFEWLLREWEAWQGPPAHWLLTDTAAYLLITWTGLDLAGVDFNSADDAVIACLVAASAVLVRARRGASKRSDYVWLGVILGVGFLAKSAFQVVIPVVLLSLAILLPKPRRWLPVGIAAACTLVCIVPFLAALSIAKGRPVVSDAGWLNYSWQVTGYGVEGYKEEVYPAPPSIPHPIAHLLEKPRVISYANHLVGTTPIHFDPSWWCEGYPRFVNLPRQWLVLDANIEEVFEELWPSPAVWFAVAVFPFGIRRACAGLKENWFLWMASAVMTAAFCAVFVLSRYTAAPFTLVGFALIAAGWKIRMPQWAIAATIILLVLMSSYPRLPDWGYVSGALWTELHSGVWKDFRELSGAEPPDDVFVLRAYQKMKAEGFQPGDRAGIIGLTLAVQWLQLLEGQEVAAIPARIYHLDDEAGRPLDFTWEKPDEFWKSAAADRERAIAAMKQAGAKWVFASQTPTWADVSGWVPITPEKNLRDEDTKGTLYFRRL